MASTTLSNGNLFDFPSVASWREPEVSPKNQGFHYNQNAETYMLGGEALGKGMLKLHRNRKSSD